MLAIRTIEYTAESKSASRDRMLGFQNNWMNDAGHADSGGVALRPFPVSATRMQASKKNAPIVNTVARAVAPVMLRSVHTFPAASNTGSGVGGIRLKKLPTTETP